MLACLPGLGATDCFFSENGHKVAINLKSLFLIASPCRALLAQVLEKETKRNEKILSHVYISHLSCSISQENKLKRSVSNVGAF